MKVIYQNGKIYTGRNVTDSINYFGNANSEFIAKDFTHEARQDFTIRKGALWESKASSRQEANQKELEFIRKYESTNPRDRL